MPWITNTLESLWITRSCTQSWCLMIDRRACIQTLAKYHVLHSKQANKGASTFRMAGTVAVGIMWYEFVWQSLLDQHTYISLTDYFPLLGSIKVARAREFARARSLVQSGEDWHRPQGIMLPLANNSDILKYLVKKLRNKQRAAEGREQVVGVREVWWPAACLLRQG